MLQAQKRTGAMDRRHRHFRSRAKLGGHCRSYKLPVRKRGSHATTYDHTRGGPNDDREKAFAAARSATHARRYTDNAEIAKGNGETMNRMP